MKFHSFIFLLFIIICSLDASAQFSKKAVLGDTSRINLMDQLGKKHGNWVFSTAGGKGEPAISEFGNYEHGKKWGLWYKITKDGELLSIESFKNDQLDGEVKYYDLGKLYCIGNYLGLNPVKQLDTIVVIDPISHLESYKVISSQYGSVRHGQWRYYEPETGFLVREEEYIADELVFKKDVNQSKVDSALVKKREMMMPHKKMKKGFFTAKEQ